MRTYLSNSPISSHLTPLDSECIKTRQLITPQFIFPVLFMLINLSVQVFTQSILKLNPLLKITIENLFLICNHLPPEQKEIY